MKRFAAFFLWLLLLFRLLGETSKSVFAANDWLPPLYKRDA